MSKPSRIAGYDLARFLAVFGFVAVDMVGRIAWSDDGGGYGERPEGPAFLYWMWQGWWGRASTMLAVLAGTGLALMFRKGLSPSEEAKKKRVVLWRCLFLFGVGHLWNSSTLWSWSILHYYTFFMAIGLLFTRARPRTLAFAALLFTTVATLDTLAFRETPDWDLPVDGIESVEAPGLDGSEAELPIVADVPLEPALGEVDLEEAAGEDGWDDDWEGDFGDPKIWEAKFWSLRHHISSTLFDGVYPVFPWMAFLLIGMAVVRIGIEETRRRRQILLGAIIITALSYGAWWAARHFELGEQAELLTSVNRMACMPLYVLAASGQAVILLCVSLSIASMWPTARWLPPLVATGQMTFSVYIFRIFIGGGDRAGLYDLIGFAPGTERGPLVDGWIRVALFMLFTVWICHWWVRRYGRGPLETAMRRFSDR